MHWSTAADQPKSYESCLTVVTLIEGCPRKRNSAKQALSAHTAPPDIKPVRGPLKLAAADAHMAAHRMSRGLPRPGLGCSVRSTEGSRSMNLKLGYKASAEQFAPRPLMDFSVAAEQAGFDSVFVSDHFQPWRHTDGHAPSALSWLGALGACTQRIVMGTSVLTPTFRYHPSIV